MEIICNQNEFNNAMHLVSKAVASRPTHPILANILLTADEGTNKISVTGFDLNLGIQTSFDGTVKNSGAITIPSKLLSEIVNKLPNGILISSSIFFIFPFAALTDFWIVFSICFAIFNSFSLHSNSM